MSGFRLTLTIACNAMVMILTRVRIVRKVHRHQVVNIKKQRKVFKSRQDAFSYASSYDPLKRMRNRNARIGGEAFLRCEHFLCEP